MAQFQHPYVGIFQDSENCSFSDKIPVAHILENIESSLQKVDEDYRVCAPVMVYSGNRHVYNPTQHASIKELGFRFLEAHIRKRSCATNKCKNVDQPGEVDTDMFERSFNVADSLLMEEMLGEALLGKLPPNVLVVSNDRDFNLATKALYLTRRYNIFVAKNWNTNGKINPTPYALFTWVWPKMQQPGGAHPRFTFSDLRNI